jgi:two-component system OmpR family response regulator
VRKLLIVDDDVHIRRLLKIQLRQSGYEIHEAGTGEEATSLLEEHQFDVVFLDLILPYYGGFRLCQKFRSSGGHQPFIIIITGDDSPETRTTAEECGSDAFLAKPFSEQDVMALIESVPVAG